MLPCLPSLSFCPELARCARILVGFPNNSSPFAFVHSSANHPCLAVTATFLPWKAPARNRAALGPRYCLYRIGSGIVTSLGHRPDRRRLLLVVLYAPHLGSPVPYRAALPVSPFRDMPYHSPRTQCVFLSPLTRLRASVCQRQTLPHLGRVFARVMASSCASVILLSRCHDTNGLGSRVCALL